MEIGILGTGAVGRTIGTKLISLGHSVTMGSRTSDNEKAAEWVHQNGPNALQGTFADAAAFGNIIFNCTKGMITLDILKMAGAENLRNKILVDITNPLDFTKGFPPTLTVCNDDSLGEQIQRAFPDTLVVKALNTMNCNIMVDPMIVNDGDHNVFICGNDAGAKNTVTDLLRSFGWLDDNIIDLGDISNSRGTEQVLPLWVRLMGVVGNAMFQFKVVK